MSILHKNQTLVADFASTVESRPELTAVHWDGKRAVSTDSYRLACVEVKDPSHGDYATVYGYEEKEITEPIMIPAKAVKEIGKKLKKNKSLPILNHAAFGGVEDQTVKFFSTDLDTLSPTVSRVIEGKYPAWETIMPDEKTKPLATVRLNASYIESVGKLMKKTSRGGLEDVTIEIYGEKEPVIFRAEDSETQTTVLVMPIKN